MYIFRSRLASMPAFKLITITVVLSLFTLAFNASDTRYYATSVGSYSIISFSMNFLRARSTHSLLENLSYKPSEARIIKSSVDLFSRVVRISGSHRTKSL